VFGNRAIANVALQSQFGQARFHGAFSGSAWPWWRGGLVLGWFGPLFWPYAYYDLFDYVYWPYAYDVSPIASGEWLAVSFAAKLRP
jgi:hypothetical protein